MLYPYQKEGVDFLLSRKQGFLWDEPGLGKTVQALTYLSHTLNGALVICPASVKTVWAQEATKWGLPFTTTILNGRGKFRWPVEGELIIINPDILPDDTSRFIWNIPHNIRVVVDEAHQFKNFRAKRAKILNTLAKAISASGGSIHGMTGTPILSSPSDLYGLLYSFNLLPQTYRTWTNFCHEWRGVNTKFGWRFPSNPPAGAMVKLNNLYLRRLKSDVLKDLPQKIFVDIQIESEPLEELDLDEGVVEKAIASNHLSAWRSVNAASKAIGSLGYVKNLVDGGEQVVVFSAYRNGVTPFASIGGVITGETSLTERKELADKFQTGQVRCLAGTIGAMGVGLTLTAACHVVFIDRDWTPALNKQAEDRVCRIGQTRGTIVVDVVSDNNTDKLVTRVLQRKTRLLDSVGL